MLAIVKRLWKNIATLFTQHEVPEAVSESKVRNTQIMIGGNNKAVQNNYNGLSREEYSELAEQVIADNTASDEEVNEMLDEVFGHSTNTDR
ncbi:MAG: hypothetical protein IJS28_04180 [Synergistaceae bacterium]|nr:hypothetical protein [Synergistaceae bacterium]